jgi:hypothetical protein
MSDPLNPGPAEAILGHNNPPFAVELAERQGPLKLRVDALIQQAEALPKEIETEEQHLAAALFLRDATSTLVDVASAHTTEKAPLKLKTDAIDEFFLSKGLKGRLEPLKNAISSRNGAYQLKLAEERRQEQIRIANEQAAAAAKRVEEAAALETAGRHTEAAVKMEGAQAQEVMANNAEIKAAAPARDLGRTYSGAGTSSLVVGAEPVVDMDTVDLDKLRPFLKLADIEAAVKALAKARGLKPQDLLDGKLSIKGVTFNKTANSRVR